MLNHRSDLGRALLVALAAMAVALMLLRPACSLWNSHHLETGDSSVQCCSSVSHPDFAVPLQAAPGLPAAQGFAAAAFIVIVISAMTFTGPLHRLRAPPRGPHSYHLRTSRILR